MSTPPHNDTNPHTHTEFHPFPLLPTELRLLIWHIALTEPRTVHLKCQRAVHPLIKRRFAVSFESPTPQPALLFVNAEARAVAQTAGNYKEWFRVDEDKSIYLIAGAGAGAGAEQNQDQNQEPPTLTQTPAPHPSPEPSHPQQSPQPILIAFNLDTLHLREDVLAYIPSTERSLTERLIVDVADVQYFGHFYLDVIRSMERLRTLDLFVGFTESDWLLAGRDAGNASMNESANGSSPAGAGADAGLAHGRLQRGLGLLEDEFLEMKGRYPEWKIPDVRVLMRGTGDVLLRISAEEETN
ncbi:hypothetical protein BDV19DRAFT_389943 [Aspergillus venezuelensis]